MIIVSQVDKYKLSSKHITTILVILAIISIIDCYNKIVDIQNKIEFTRQLQTNLNELLIVTDEIANNRN